MATIAEFTVPTDDFPLGRIFEHLPNATVELERVVPTNEYVLPYFWIRNNDASHIEDALDDETAFESVALIDDLDDRGLFRATWNQRVEGVLTAITEAGLTLLSAVGTGEIWTFEFRAEDSDAILAFQQYCADRDIDAQLVRLKSLAEMEAGDEYNLTSNQYEALLLAVNEGYYDESRKTTLETLADRLDISRPAFADRLRRGTRNLLKSTIAHYTPGDDAPD
ncbi:MULTISPECIES: bacterio-opsin activator domain-containing protein [Halorussus]|uniref:helix-turn-helix domain-containing protein n=1 Tax=Halorussus TaxID=1070314 RepID=UPI0020A17634|nr:helix-turn-helix domain-containing protein [Halorussus vallis]USZ75176.1 helix-turn-helix domain-containing protein [Halorussus vallis]